MLSFSKSRLLSRSYTAQTSFGKSRSGVQSNATRIFFVQAGQLAQVTMCPRISGDESSIQRDHFSNKLCAAVDGPIARSVSSSYDTMVAKLLTAVLVVEPDYLQVTCGAKHVLSI